MVFIKNLIPLSILYCFEGILLGLITYSVPQELKDKIEDFDGFYQFQFIILLPYLLRYLIAPLFDSFSWERGGRRRSQLCILYLCLGVLLYFSNLQTVDQDSWFWKMFWIICILACIDMVVASWLVESLNPEDRGYGALAQFVGIIVGGFMGAYIFQMFNSLEFCNTYIYAIPQELPYITIQMAFKELAFVSLGLSIACIIIIQNETAVNQDLADVFRSATHAFNNHHLIVLFLFFCLFRIGQMPIDLAHVHMQRKNFTSGQIQFLEILTFPLACVLPYYMAKMIKNGALEIRLIVVFSIYQIIISGAFIITLFATEEEFPFPYRDIILKISLIGSWLLNITNITLAYSYIYKSVRSTIATTFIALLTTGINFQFIFEGIVHYLLVNYNYYLIWLIGVGFYALFFFHIASRTTTIDQLECQEFCMEIDIKKEKLLIQTELTTLS